MRLIVWNCQMAFRRKHALLEGLKPDLLVIPESESPAFLGLKKASLPWPNHIWVGDNPAKGLSVFARAGLSLRLKRNHIPAHRFIAPVHVTTSQKSFDLFAFWTQAGPTQRQSYVAHSLNAFGPYLKSLRRDSLLAGDFNSSPVFKTNGKGHAELVARLGKRGFDSLYHRLHDQTHGWESEATFWLHRDRAKPYHLDYVFAHHSTTPRALTIGRPGDWLAHSDHAPLILDF